MEISIEDKNNQLVQFYNMLLNDKPIDKAEEPTEDLELYSPMLKALEEYLFISESFQLMQSRLWHSNDLVDKLVFHFLTKKCLDWNLVNAENNDGHYQVAYHDLLQPITKESGVFKRLMTKPGENVVNN